MAVTDRAADDEYMRRQIQGDHRRRTDVRTTLKLTPTPVPTSRGDTRLHMGLLAVAAPGLDDDLNPHGSNPP
jgi:hypothetical protein